MGKSNIEWTTDTWNPVTGCTKISEGCRNCYAERVSHRLKAWGAIKYSNAFDLTLHPEEIDKPMRQTKPRLIFVNSMSDLFHKDVPLDFIKQVFRTMNIANQHQFQVLTKRADLLEQCANELTWSNNIWMGVSVEDEKAKWRIDHLAKTPAYIKFLSIEPLIGEIKDLDLNSIDWVIVGGESGPNSRLMEESWVKRIRDICKEQNVAFFFKQWGGKNKKATGCLLDGKEYKEWPKKYLFGRLNDFDMPPNNLSTSLDLKLLNHKVD